MARIAIIGPGAIGSLLAAWLTQTGRHTVILCGRRPLSRLQVESPTGAFTFSPHVVIDPERAAPVDFVLVTTKSYDAEATARWFPTLVGPHTAVAILQNGVEHVARFASHLAPAQILPVIVMIAAERPAQTRIVHRGPSRLAVPAGRAGEAFAALLAGTPVEMDVADDFTTVAWRKLAGNTPGILNALLLQPTGAFADPPLAALARSLAAECVAVGRAEGAKLGDDVPDAVVRGLCRIDPNSVNSMHADRIAGRPLELDARNGVILRLGRRHGIPTPLNQMAVTLLAAMLRTDLCQGAEQPPPRHGSAGQESLLETGALPPTKPTV